MRLIIALFWAVLIAVLHIIPGEGFSFVQLDDLFRLDKLFHLTVFAIGAWLLIPIFLQQYTKQAFRCTFIVYVFYGLILDLMQGFFLKERQANVLDWIADILGVLLALLLYQKIYPNETIKS